MTNIDPNEFPQGSNWYVTGTSERGYEEITHYCNKVTGETRSISDDFSYNFSR